jgi:hypothetical protein
MTYHPADERDPAEGPAPVSATRTDLPQVTRTDLPKQTEFRLVGSAPPSDAAWPEEPEELEEEDTAEASPLGGAAPGTLPPVTAPPRAPAPGTAASGTPAPGSAAPGAPSPGTAAPGTPSPGAGSPQAASPATPVATVPNATVPNQARRPAAAGDGGAGIADNEPLLSGLPELRAGWQRAKSAFVDNPRGAVAEAAGLADEAAEALAAALRERRQRIRDTWDGDGPARDTEALRLALLRYQALFNRIVGD